MYVQGNDAISTTRLTVHTGEIGDCVACRHDEASCRAASCLGICLDAGLTAFGT